MLSHEQAQAQLQQQHQRISTSERLAQAAKLPEKLREVVYYLLDLDSQGKALGWEQKENNFTYMLTCIDNLSDAERLSLFTFFFPQFAPTVAQAWQLFDRLPYQIGYLRRAFHAPNHPELHREKRLNWLTHLIQTYDGYEGDLVWLAAWCPYISYYRGDEYGLLFAAAIEQGDELGKEIYSTLVASAQGEHEIGMMGRHITRALLVANYPEGWQFIENLLIAAQRQEGLRQVILETIDEAHPLAFQKFLKLIVEQDLTRFSATVRAADVWFGLGWEAVNHRVVKQSLAQVSGFLEDRESALQSLDNDEPERVYLAVWSIAFADVFTAIPLGIKLLNSDVVELRFVAVRLLSQLSVKEAQLALIPALKDADLRVAALALANLINNSNDFAETTDLFEVLESILSSFPSKPRELKYLVWDWLTLKPCQSWVTTALLNNLGKRSPTRLIPYLPILAVYERVQVARLLAEIKPWDKEIRETLFSLVGDASQAVRVEVISVISKSEVSEEEIIVLEKLLTRKSADLRRGILQLILN
jgi:hypothetical protein